ncbi:AbrB family transcriptional regulator [Halobacteriales archaeon QS_8_69_26]|nr:MAG: AbrB family transcriptional regulator [Halobacteriales archaeon QS_8_69_26]
MSETTRVTEKGQATIPKELREKYGIESGDEVVWEETDDGIVLRKKHDSARGALVPDGTPPEKREEVARELERRVEEIRTRNQPPGTDLE